LLDGETDLDRPEAPGTVLGKNGVLDPLLDVLRDAFVGVLE